MFNDNKALYNSELTKETATALFSALNVKNTRLKGAVLPAELTYKFKNELFVFSGFKTFNQLKEASDLLLDEKGKIKDFKTFKKDVKKIDEKYNDNYLRVERNYAISSSQSAAEWQNFKALKDTHDFKYTSVNDGRTRDDHRKLDGTVAAYDSAFLRKYTPPIDWECRCYLEPVPKGTESTLLEDEANKLGKKATTRLNKDGVNKAEMFRYNPGLDEILFPQTHPYYDVPANIKKQLKAKIYTANSVSDATWIAKQAFNIKKVDFASLALDAINEVLQLLKAKLDKNFIEVSQLMVKDKLPDDQTNIEVLRKINNLFVYILKK